MNAPVPEHEHQHQHEPWRLGIAGASAAYVKGALTPPQVLQAILQRLEALNPALNAFATVDAEGASRAAEQSRLRYAQGQPLGPLDGVVMSVKDNITVAGLPCRWGTAVFRDFVPDRDETPVARLRAAGVVLLGKTAVSEFSNGRGIVSTPSFGTTRNPWRLELTTGSSSGGAVAAVAAGLGCAALATDGGGSIRIPAAYCGLVGLKPSAGQVARAHGLPIIMNGQEVIGPIARSAVDLDLIMRVIAKPYAEDAASWRMTPWPQHDLTPELGAQRILCVTSMAGRNADAAVEAACRAVAEDLKKLGHTVEAGALPLNDADIASARQITKAGMAWLLRGKQWQGQVDDYYAGVVQAGAQLSAADYVEAGAAARRVQAQVGRLLQHYDMVLTPTTLGFPGPAEVPAQGDYTVFTAFANISGVPAVTAPAGLSTDGLPIGFQLTGRFGRDRDLLGMVLALQRYRGIDALHWPPLAR